MTREKKPKIIRHKLKDKIIFGHFFETEEEKEDRKKTSIMKE